MPTNNKSTSPNSQKTKLTPYHKFVKIMYKELHEKFPKDTAPEIMKKISAKWRETKTDNH